MSVKTLSAFPYDEWLDTLDPYTLNPIRHSGMTLRDYFAAKAMNGIIGQVFVEASKQRQVDPHDVMQKVAKAAYTAADEMLKAREDAQ